MTDKFCPTDVSVHKLELNIGLPIIVMHDVFQPKIVNGKLFLLKRCARRAFYADSMDGCKREQFDLHLVKYQFNFQVVKISRMQFPVRLAFSGTVRKD